MQEENEHAPSLRFNEERPLVFTDRNIAIPLWGVISMICIFITATAYLVNTLNALNNQISGLKDQLNQQWTISDMSEMSAEMKDKNKGFEAPNVYEIHRRVRQ